MKRTVVGAALVTALTGLPTFATAAADRMALPVGPAPVGGVLADVPDDAVIEVSLVLPCGTRQHCAAWSAG